MTQSGAHSRQGAEEKRASQQVAAGVGKPPVRMVRAGSHFAGSSSATDAHSAADATAGTRFAQAPGSVQPTVVGVAPAFARSASGSAAGQRSAGARPAAHAGADVAAAPAVGAVAPHPVTPSSYTQGSARGAGKRAASKRASGHAGHNGRGGDDGGNHGGPRRGSGADGHPRRRGSIVATVLIIVGVALLLTAGGLFIKAQIGYQQAQSSYKDLEKYAVSDTAGDGVPNVDFDELAKINADVVGWIYVPGTPINYPVVQTDNNTTYLSLLFDKTGNGSGSIFMDMDDTAPGMVDEQTTLYGHHMNDGSMFRAIDGTLDQAAFDKIGNVYYITRATTYVLKPLFTAQVEDTYVNARRAVFEGTDTSLQEYLTSMLDQAKAQSADADELVKNTKQVLTLVTCAGEIIPRTTRAAMVCTVTQTIDRSTGTVTDINVSSEG